MPTNDGGIELRALQALDYRTALLQSSNDGAVDFDALVARLSDAATRAYRCAFGVERDLLETTPGAVTYLFDATFVENEDEAPPRLVATWGRVSDRIVERDRDFMRGFPLPSTEMPVDRGHLHARSLGGDEGIGINLIPQDRQMNRGMGAVGRRWRALERAAAADPGAGLFTHCIYDNVTDVPACLEALLTGTDGAIRLERLPNRPHAR